MWQKMSSITHSPRWQNNWRTHWVNFSNDAELNLAAILAGEDLELTQDQLLECELLLMEHIIQKMQGTTPQEINTIQ
jgi:hypothetical protein